MPGCVTCQSHHSTQSILALTLCPGNCADLWRTQPANFLMFLIRAEATGQEGSRKAEQKSLLKMIRKGHSGSQPSTGTSGTNDQKTGGHETPTPPGTLTPDITAPDSGTTRGRPAGVVTAIRSVSLMTAVYSILRANSRLTTNTLARKGSFSRSS
jgi:hypothetical protein